MLKGIGSEKAQLITVLLDEGDAGAQAFPSIFKSGVWAVNPTSPWIHCTGPQRSMGRGLEWQLKELLKQIVPFSATRV